MVHDPPTVCVLAPNLCLSVTIESGTHRGHDDVHVHPGGQGFWIARLLRRLGESPVLISLLGGEIGGILSGLVPQWGLVLAPVQTEANSVALVFDRRSGSREELSRSQSPHPNRHELDDLYGSVLERASQASLCVVTGQEGGGYLPADLFRRLSADLHATNVPVVADLHGEEVDSLLRGGPVQVLKVSDEDLALDGRLPPVTTIGQRVKAARDLQARGASNVVISSSEGPTVAAYQEDVFVARTPKLQAVDHRGSGDSMTAGLALAYRRGLEPKESLRLACAAGAANVTRHGPATASAELIEQLAGQTEVETVERSESRGGSS
ncbi:MAG: phosphofructokinase [Actinobacteria bacterium]|nr:phosphofructokinase [Actinomycetota bacterium]